MVSFKIEKNVCTTSVALREYLPLILVQSSEPLNWPGILVRHYSSQEVSGKYHIPSTPENLIILTISKKKSFSKTELTGLKTNLTISKETNITLIAAKQPAVINVEKQTNYDHVHLNSELWNKLTEQTVGIKAGLVKLNTMVKINDSFMEDILLKLLMELKQGGKGSHLFVQALSQALIVHILRHYLTYKKKVSFSNNTECLTGYKFKQVQTYIEEHLYDKISLQKLSNLVGFSAFHFARLYKATAGITPYQYITKWRIEQSQRLFLETNLPIIQIGFEVGIDNPSHFSSFFKQNAGVTPSVYRKVMEK